MAHSKSAECKDAARIEHARTLENVPWCEDYEKMISGMLYKSDVPELVDCRFRSRRLMRKYNTHFPDDATTASIEADRAEILRGMLGRVGKDVFIEPPISFDYGCNISIGDSFYANFNLVILDGAPVTIGNRVKFGPGVSIFSATHDTGPQSRRDLVEFAHPVSVGDDCWLGGNTTVMPGVTIGKGCTIGAGSVVTRDVPDFSVAVGVPARVIKTLDPVPDV